VALACLILAASGAVRVTQERRFGIAWDAATVAPFPLKELPGTMGDHWVIQGGEQPLDEETLQIAGSVDHVARTYADEKTGVALSVLVVFGPAERVFPHAPTVCFPSFGFKPADGEGARRHSIAGAAFDSYIYTRRDGSDRTEVFFSYWHDGRWSPTAAATKKRFRHRPDMFKVQVQRLVGPNEQRGSTGDELSPIEDFLSYLVPEIEKRIAASRIGTGRSESKQQKASPNPSP
jgi:hypothetical protein